MARPIKDNADYFSHDTSMRDDPKIKALRRKFKAEGYGIWCMLLESITDSDCFRLKIDYEIMSGDYDVDPERLREVVEYCLKLELLQSNTSETVIWSKTLDARMSPLLSKRIKAKEQAKEQPRVNGKFSNNTDEPDISVTETPQSKVKESKAFIEIGAKRDFYIIVKAKYTTDKLMMIYDLEKFFDNTGQLENLKFKGWTNFDVFMGDNPGRIFNDEGHLYNTFKDFSSKYQPPARAPNEFVTAEVDRDNYTLEAWEQTYAYDLKHNEKFKKHFGYNGKLSPSQPVGSHNKN